MSEGNTKTKHRILFVDDEPRVLIALKAMFRDYEVLTANSGQQALELLADNDVDVIVSDQRMPQMTGVEFLQAARERRPRAIRILLTGYSDLNAIIGAINEGEIFRFVNKPWTNEELRATVAAAVEASAVEQLPDGPPAPAVPEEETKKDIGILVVDDDEAASAALREILSDQYDVHYASTLEKGLDMLGRYPIGVIVTEIVVGGEWVTGVLAALRQKHPTLVAIVVAAQGDAAKCIEMINHGQIYRFLRKPVRKDTLRGSVTLALRRFETLRHHPEQTKRIAAQANSQVDSTLLKKVGRLLRLEA